MNHVHVPDRDAQLPRLRRPVDFQAAVSVNADRRPDLRDAILDGSFQRMPCPKCSKHFRLDPQLTYSEVGRGQWIAAFPIAKLGTWKEFEDVARTSFNQAYGPQASAMARELGAGMKPRVTFGWGGLRKNSWRLIISSMT